MRVTLPRSRPLTPKEAKHFLYAVCAADEAAAATGSSEGSRPSIAAKKEEEESRTENQFRIATPHGREYLRSTR
jgi:hypothetical protein